MTSHLPRFVLLGLTLGAGRLPAQSVQGQRYTIRMTADGETEVVAAVREGNGRARIDLERSRDDAGDGGYILVTAGSATVVLVHPEKREYTVVDDTTFERIVGKALRVVTETGILQVQLRDVRIEPERLGAGEAIAGHPTRRYRLTQEYNAYVGAFGIVGNEPVHQTVVTDYWVSPRLGLLRNPLVELLAGVETALAQRSAAFVRRSSAARDSLFRGAALRIVVTARSTGDGAAKERRIEITDLAPAALDPVIWTIPSGYHQRQGGFSFDVL